jgi:hypothetical protein
MRARAEPCLHVAGDQRDSKQNGDSRNRGKAGQPACPVTTPDRRGRADAHLWRGAGCWARRGRVLLLPRRVYARAAQRRCSACSQSTRSASAATAGEMAAISNCRKLRRQATLMPAAARVGRAARTSLCGPSDLDDDGEDHGATAGALEDELRELVVEGLFERGSVVDVVVDCAVARLRFVRAARRGTCPRPRRAGRRGSRSRAARAFRRLVRRGSRRRIRPRRVRARGGHEAAARSQPPAQSHSVSLDLGCRRAVRPDRRRGACRQEEALRLLAWSALGVLAPQLVHRYAIE